MITFTNTITIDRLPADIYAYLSDLENTPEWNWAISETTKTTSGPVTVGTRYRQSRTVPQPTIETVEITALDPNRHIEIQGTLAALAARVSYDLIELDGATTVANTVNLEPHGPLRLAGAVLGPRIKKAVARNLKDLKQRLETATPTRHDRPDKPGNRAISERNDPLDIHVPRRGSAASRSGM